MLSSILSKKTCSDCRICCSFVEADVWEAPSFSASARDFLLAQNPNLRFVTDEDGFFRHAYEFENENQIKLCPALDEKTGCSLPDGLKPKECSLWPLRAFMEGENLHLCLALACPAFSGENIKKIEQFLEACESRPVYEAFAGCGRLLKKPEPWQYVELKQTKIKQTNKKVLDL